MPVQLDNSNRQRIGCGNSRHGISLSTCSSHTNANQYSNKHSDPHAFPDTDTDINPIADGHEHANPDKHSDQNADFRSHADPFPHSDKNTHPGHVSDSDQDPDQNADLTGIDHDTDPDTHSEPDRNIYHGSIHLDAFTYTNSSTFIHHDTSRLDFDACPVPDLNPHACADCDWFSGAAPEYFPEQANSHIQPDRPLHIVWTAQEHG